MEASFVMLLQDKIPRKVKYLSHRLLLLFCFLCLHFMFEERRLHKFRHYPMVTADSGGAGAKVGQSEVFIIQS